jgi:hypothetical protein
MNYYSTIISFHLYYYSTMYLNEYPHGLKWTVENICPNARSLRRQSIWTRWFHPLSAAHRLHRRSLSPFTSPVVSPAAAVSFLSAVQSFDVIYLAGFIVTSDFFPLQTFTVEVLEFSECGPSSLPSPLQMDMAASLSPFFSALIQCALIRVFFSLFQMCFFAFFFFCRDLSLCLHSSLSPYVFLFAWLFFVFFLQMFFSSVFGTLVYGSKG